MGKTNPVFKENYRGYLRELENVDLSLADETSNVYRGFSTECGASLFWHPRDRKRISVAAGSLDEPTGLQTIWYVWTSQMGDYYEILDDLPRYAEGWQA